MADVHKGDKTDDMGLIDGEDSGAPDDDAPTESQIKEWAITGDVNALETLVLDGRGHLLQDLPVDNAHTREFLKALPQYQARDSHDARTHAVQVS